MKLGLSAYLGLAIVIGKNSGDVQHKAYVSACRHQNVALY